MAKHTPAQQLYDLLVSRDFDPELLTSAGKPSEIPSETEIFSFGFQTEQGTDYGTVVIMLGEENNMEIYFGDNIGHGMEADDKREWFDFLYQLRMFAKRNLMSFGLKNLNRLRYSMQGQAAIKEGLFESWAGKRDISWNAGATESRLMIKHKRALGEGEARFRCIESLFIETAEGERYKLPFRNLTAGKAMLEHVRAGGRPYDDRGQHISEMVTELNVLTRFRRANAGRLLEGDTAVLVEKTTAYYETLRHNLKSLTTQGGYGRYFESWNPTALTEESAVIDGLKHMFVTQSIDQRIEDALPLLARIQQQENAMKETEIFEAWADRLMEGTWALPDTPEKQAELLKLMSTELPVGADATNATEQLYDLLGDDELFDQLQALADRDANADARQVIYDRMQQLNQNSDVLKVINSLNIDADLELDTPESVSAEIGSQEDKVEEMLGGDAADDLILDVSIKEPQDEMEEAVKDPAGTEQSAYPEYQDDLASILKTAGVPAQERPAPDYEPEVLETANTGVTPADIDGVPKQELDEFAPLVATIGDALGRAAVGTAAGAITRGLAGMAGSAIGNAISGDDEIGEAQCNMTEAGTQCEVHGIAECGMEEAATLQGKYGHSGRMRPVDQDNTFLTRLRELSGMIKT